MAKQDVDAIVVGAGPSGSSVAKIIAEKGYQVLILEEHAQVGLPQHCTGKISTNALNELNLPKKGVLNEVRGALFHSPDMNVLKIERNARQALIFNRAEFDQNLLNKALDSGAKIITNAHALDLKIDPHAANIIYKLNNERQRASAKIIIGADGATSLIARRSGLYPKHDKTIKLAIQREIINVREVQPEFVEVYLGEKIAPGFFIWIVPIGVKTVRVGLCTDYTHGQHLLDYLESFITHHPLVKKRFEESVCISQVAHILPASGATRKTVSNGVLLVGDAAGQIKSTTGGGIYYGVLCGQIAGQVISEALSETQNILQRDTLAKYETTWRKNLGMEIRKNEKIRQLLDALSDDELNYCFQIIRKDSTLSNLIQTEGDIDRQSKLIIPLFRQLSSTIIRKPLLFRKIAKFLLTF
ncbi:MAG: NAD(P)/FAD-dependent oxidoreductase [Candidatus Bathyarchaeota archaeon]|nr:MAG: NAD(P)/FAD-dependent oxidoreductase [Candidatus Bathyarchaeota archaeon]